MLQILSTAVLCVFFCAGKSLSLPWSISTSINKLDSQWMTQDENQLEVYIDQSYVHVYVTCLVHPAMTGPCGG